MWTNVIAVCNKQSSKQGKFGSDLDSAVQKFLRTFFKQPSKKKISSFELSISYENFDMNRVAMRSSWI